MVIIPGDIPGLGKFIRPKEGKPRCFWEKTLFFSKVLVIHLGRLHLMDSLVKEILESQNKEYLREC